MKYGFLACTPLVLPMQLAQRRAIEKRYGLAPANARGVAGWVCCACCEVIKDANEVDTRERERGEPDGGRRGYVRPDSMQYASHRSVGNVIGTTLLFSP